MSDIHIEALEELCRDVQDAYDEEVFRSGKGDSGSSSVRDLEHSHGSAQDDDDTSSSVPRRLELLESWRVLVSALERAHAFLQYTPSLEHHFTMEADDPAVWNHIKTLLDHMKETVDNHDKEPCQECRFVTLIEIMSSFSRDWSPSPQIKVQWGEFEEPVPSDMSAIDFRRSAYNVLMSLPWLSNLHGLSELCQVSDDGSSKLDTSAVDPAWFANIRGAPLARADHMHRLLERFRDDKPATVAITATQTEGPQSQQGLGKTTLAMMVASHSDIQSQYTVLRLRLDHKSQDGGMKCARYLTYLESLCKQLGQRPDWIEKTLVLEDPSFRHMREERRMVQAKRQMTDILATSPKHVLIILDDVTDDQEIEWFWFLQRQSLLVTTCASTLSVGWTLELGALSEDEALDLFLTEAGYSLDHVLSTSLEAQTIVERCRYHPLTIRTAARWFHLKQATAGVVNALEELDLELGACTAKLRYARNSSSAIHLLTEIMDLMLSPMAPAGQPTTLMKLCLASMAVVFQGRVPLDAVHVLWGKLLQTDSDAIQELGDGLTCPQIHKRVGFISKALASLGILSIVKHEDGTHHAEIHHDLQLEYALNLARDMQVRNTGLNMTQSWHGAFATAYVENKETQESDASGNCEAYAIEKLVFHMVEAKMFVKASTTLNDAQFVDQRMSSRCYQNGVQTLLDDFNILYCGAKAAGTSMDDIRQMTISVLVPLSSFLVAKAGQIEKEGLEDIGKAIHKVGMSLAEKKCLSKASAQYKGALKLVPKSNHVTGTLYYSLSAVDLQKNDISKAQKHIQSCFKAMAHHDTSHPYYGHALLLKGKIQTRACDYRGALKSFNQALEWFSDDSIGNRMEIGIALDRKASVLATMDETEAALDTLEEAVETKLAIGEQSCDLGMIYKRFGDIHSETCNDDEAEQLYNKALRVWENAKDKVDRANILMVKGRVSYLHGECTECFASFHDALRMTKCPRLSDLCWFARRYSTELDNERAISVLEDALAQTTNQPDSLERASILFDMANCYFARQMFDKALAATAESLDIRTRTVGEAEVTLRTAEFMADVHSRAGDNDKAIECYNEVIKLVESVYGEGNQRLAKVLFSLGEVKIKNANVDEGIALLTECLEIRRKHLGPNNADLAGVLERLGDVHIESGSVDKAYKFHSECLKVRQASLDPEDPVLATSLHRMGAITRKRGDCERGLHFLLNALKIRTVMEDQQLACGTLLEIGHVHRQSGDSESAAGCYKKCLEILVANLQYQSESGGDVYLSLGHANKNLGNTEEALQNYEKALAIRTDIFGSDDILTGAVYRSLGILEYQTERYDSAKTHLLEFMRIQNAKKAKGGTDKVLALLFLGDLHYRNFKLEEAKTSWSSGLRTFQQTSIAMKCPDLGPQLERRLAKLEERMMAKPKDPEGRPRMKREGSVFARLSADLVGRLSDEQVPPRKANMSTRSISVGKGGSARSLQEPQELERDPEEDEIHNSIFLDG